MNIQNFREAIDSVQRNQYFYIKFFHGDNEVLIKEPCPEFMTALTRSLEEKDNLLEWRILVTEEKDVWQFLETIQYSKEGSKNSLKVSFASSRSAVLLGGFHYYGISVKDIKIEQKLSQEDECGQVLTMNIKLGFTNKAVFSEK